jgi:hypothetical protein
MLSATFSFFHVRTPNKWRIRCGWIDGGLAAHSEIEEYSQAPLPPSIFEPWLDRDYRGCCLAISLAFECCNCAFFIRRRQMMPQSLSNDPYENPNGITFNAGGPNCGGDEISEIRFAATEPVCSSRLCVENFQP